MPAELALPVREHGHACAVAPFELGVRVYVHHLHLEMKPGLQLLQPRDHFLPQVTVVAAIDGQPVGPGLIRHRRGTDGGASWCGAGPDAPLVELSHHLVELLDGFHVLVVDRQYDVAAAYARARGRALRLDVLDEHPAVELELAALRFGKLRQGQAMLAESRCRRLGAAPRLPRRLLVEHFRDHHLHVAGALVTPDLHVHFRAWPGTAHDARQVLGRPDGLAVETQDDVTGLDAGLVRRSAFLHRIHERALRPRQPESVRELLGDRLDDDAYPAARHLAGRAQLVGDVVGNVDRYREGQPHEAAGAAVDLGIDADHFSPQIEQRSAGIAGIDGDVGLNERNVVLLRQRPPLGTDDARRHGVLEAEGRADREHPFANLQPVRVAELDGRQSARVDLDERHIGAAVGADDLRLELALVGSFTVISSAASTTCALVMM